MAHHSTHLAEITDAKPHLVRRAVAARLAQICVGCHPIAAAELLGIPSYANENRLTVVKQNLHGPARHTFDAAGHSIAQHRDTTTTSVDYGKRRNSPLGHCPYKSRRP